MFYFVSDAAFNMTSNLSTLKSHLSLLFKARKVAGSTTCKQSMKLCCSLRSVCLFSHENKELFLKFVLKIKIKKQIKIFLFFPQTTQCSLKNN